jgi:hypothetical protein
MDCRIKSTAVRFGDLGCGSVVGSPSFIVVAGLVPATHAFFLAAVKTWIAVTSTAMTTEGCFARSSDSSALHKKQKSEPDSRGLDPRIHVRVKISESWC